MLNLFKWVVILQSGAMLPYYSEAYIKRVTRRVTLVLVILKQLTFDTRSTRYSSGRVCSAELVLQRLHVCFDRKLHFTALHIKYTTVRIGGYTFLLGRHELSFLLQILIQRARFYFKRVQTECSVTQYLLSPKFEELS